MSVSQMGLTYPFPTDYPEGQVNGTPRSNLHVFLLLLLLHRAGVFLERSRKYQAQTPTRSRPAEVGFLFHRKDWGSPKRKNRYVTPNQ
jgi:hypothetical protein